MAMNLWVQRAPSSAESTISSLFIDGIFECYTLEDVIREPEGWAESVKGFPFSRVAESVRTWKVPGKTAIPAGRYRVTLENSPRFGPETITVKAVPGFTDIRAHGGNKAKDTEGCLIVGDSANWDDDSISGASRGTLERLKAKIKAAIDAGEEVWITYTNT